MKIRRFNLRNSYVLHIEVEERGALGGENPCPKVVQESPGTDKS